MRIGQKSGFFTNGQFLNVRPFLLDLISETDTIWRFNNSDSFLSWFLESHNDQSDASFLMNDALTGVEANIVNEAWMQLLGKTITVESKAVPGYFWQTDAKEAFLQSQGEVFK